MRKWKREDDLKKIAEEISEQIVIRKYVNGTSYDERRPAMKVEREILYKLLYGALLGLNESEEFRKNPTAERAIISAAESTLHQFMPECNAYDSLYIPLNDAIRHWEREEAV